MNLYFISRKSHGGYDTFSAAVVAAKSAKEAQVIQPGGEAYESAWVSPAEVDVELIGKAKSGTKSGVVLSSFHAG